MIKTFRGLLLDGGEQRIRLSTKKGKIGYKIIKFQTITNDPTAEAAESVVKIFKIPLASGAAPDDKIDFSDGNLLAVSMFTVSTSHSDPEDMIVIFDQEIFNQDIFITHSNSSGSDPANYYLELETINMTDNQAVVSTLRDIRLNPQVGG